MGKNHESNLQHTIIASTGMALTQRASSAGEDSQPAWFSTNDLTVLLNESLPFDVIVRYVFCLLTLICVSQEEV